MSTYNFIGNKPRDWVFYLYESVMIVYRLKKVFRSQYGINPCFGIMPHENKVITLLKMISEDEISFLKNEFCLQHHYYKLINK